MCKENNKCNKISFKRYFLPFLGVFGLVAIDEIRNFYYFPIVFTFGFFILFWNFPFLVYYTNSQPIYYEDLFINKRKLPNYNVPENIKLKFQCIFNWTLIITSSITMGCLADYWLYKTNNLISVFEILGITGGILKIFQLVNNLCGKIMIKIVRCSIRKEKEKYAHAISETRRRSRELIIINEDKNYDMSNIPKSKSSGTLSIINNK
jgi:hypothetical protein